MTDRPDRPEAQGAPDDGRPRPQYGEYAPPGWVSPVAPVDPPPAAPGAAGAVPPSPEVAAAARADADAAVAARRPGRRVDRIVTFVLLGLAAYNVFAALLQASTFATTLLDMLRGVGYPVDAFTSQAALQRLGPLSAAAAVALFVVVVAVTRRRLRAGRITFWVPLTAGVVFVLVQTVAVITVLFGDAGFAEAMAATLPTGAPTP